MVDSESDLGIFDDIIEVVKGEKDTVLNKLRFAQI